MRSKCRVCIRCFDRIYIREDKVSKMLIDKKMKKVDLMRTAKISSNALAHLSKDESVSVEVIGKICLALECTPNDIMEFSNNVTEESTSK